MLHIILGILKITGIILAVILLLLITIVISVLFVPVRYQLKAKKETENTSAEVKVSWLLHFISFYFSYDLVKKKTEWTLRIFGVTLDQLISFIKTLTGIPGKLKKVKLIRKQTISKKPVTHDAMQIPQDTAAEEDRNVTSCEITEEKVDRIDIENNEEEDASDILLSDTEEDSVIKAEEVDSSIHDRNKCDEESDTQNISLKQRIMELVNKILSLISKFWEKIRVFPEKMNNKKEHIESNIHSLTDKIQYYLGLTEKYEVKVLLGDILTELFLLLRHYVPGKINGYLHFGTGDPAMTGELTGMIYVLLPADARDFRVLPEFTEKVFETDLIMKGKIRACHALWLAWRLYRNKKLMRLIKEIKKARSL